MLNQVTAKWALLGILVAGPLAAQDSIPVFVVGAIPIPQVVVQGDSLFVNVEVNTEELAVAFGRLQASLDSAVAALSDCDRCPSSGSTSVVSRISTGLLPVLALWIGYQLKRIADKDDVHNVEVHEHELPDDDYGESE